MGMATGDAGIPRDLEAAILRLKKERNAILLAHYYQEGDIQELADVVGDSLQLSRAAQKADKDVIVFCGVHFMAETAKILNPTRKVVVPDLEAGCSLADGCPAPAFKAFVAKHPGAAVVSYINCSAEVKALSDVICTSSNAEKIVRAMPQDKPVIFAPDRHLGRWVQKKTGRELVLWDGACIVHEQFSEKALVRLLTRHPEAQVLAHPECDESVLKHAHYVGSTTGIIEAAERSPAQVLIIATEDGVFHQIKKRVPNKELIQAPGQDESCACNQCPHMRRNTMEKLYLCLRDLQPELMLDEDLRKRALKPMERMLELSA
ncbi:MAG: quinolinate synthase NadA [Deltaproteobacteria bacterium]|nr:quinolinate synthase NadA [Deltaproteobacteria bacterium]